jgi:Fimbrial assembly protein (PilN)
MTSETRLAPAKVAATKPQPWSERAKAMFAPKWKWVGEWDGRTLRLLSYRVTPSGCVFGERFSGDLPAAEAWAQSRGIPRHGIAMALTVPGLQIKHVSPGDWQTDPQGQLETRLAQELPPGVEANRLEMRTAQLNGETYAAIMLHEGLETLFDGLGDRLGGIFSMEAGLFPLWQAVEPKSLPTSAVTLLATSDEIWVSVREADRWKVVYALAWPSEIGQASEEEAQQAIARLLRHALEYQYRWQFNAEKPQSIQIWRDQDGRLSKALALTDWTVQSPAWKASISAVPEAFRPAAALSLCLADTKASRLDFGSFGIDGIERRYRLLERTGQALVIALLLIVLTGLGELVLAVGTGIMQRMEAKETLKWSDPLSKWERLNRKRQSLKAKWEVWGPVITRGNAPAQRIAKIANALPPETWLEQWQIDQEEKGLKHDLIGYAREDSLIPVFVRKLQASGQFREVRLRATEKWSAEKVETLTRLKANRQALHRFELVVNE